MQKNRRSLYEAVKDTRKFLTSYQSVGFMVFEWETTTHCTKDRKPSGSFKRSKKCEQSSTANSSHQKISQPSTTLLPDTSSSYCTIYWTSRLLDVNSSNSSNNIWNKLLENSKNERKKSDFFELKQRSWIFFRDVRSSCAVLFRLFPYFRLLALQSFPRTVNIIFCESMCLCVV